MPPLTHLPEHFNFAGHLLAVNASRGAKTAYIDDGVTLTYADLATRVRSVAGAMLARGLRREERVLICMHDTVDFPVAFLAALHTGIVPVPVNTLLIADDFAYMLGHSRAKAVIVSAALLPMMQRALAAGANEVATVWVAAATTALPPGTIDFAECIAHAPMLMPAATGVDEIAFWLYSSG
ncbi:MAG: AMP-binding protein, partial [Betaproteobacteria bacterium]